MPEQLRISVRFLDGTFHGRGDGGEPEWPPSPLRLFQALTNAAARLDGEHLGGQSTESLRWLESLASSPKIFATGATPTNGYQLYVPDNVGDLVAKSWSCGNNDASISSYRTEKLVRPLRLSGDASVHYLWTIEGASPSEHVNTLVSIARSVSRLGWGVDLVTVDAAVEDSAASDASFSGERWLPVENSGGASLRVPIPGTLAALEKRHAAFLVRLVTTDDGKQFFRPVPPLEIFRVVTYRRDTELNRPPYAVFALRVPDDSKFATFDPLRRRLHLSGMLRHLASQAEFASLLGWDQSRVDQFVLGHDNRDKTCPRPTTDSPRLVFIPLPSIEWRGDRRGQTFGAIRRVLVTVQGHCAASEFAKIIRGMEGRELIDEKEGKTIAFLRRQSDGENAIRDYLAASAVWATVTPVILPGYDDPRKLRQRLRNSEPPLTAAEKADLVQKLDAKIDKLLRKAMTDAGIPSELAKHADLEWRGSGFQPGTDLASRYSVPDQCRRFRRLHVRITWRMPVSNGSLHAIKIGGPLCIGGGRFSGLGLLAPSAD